MACRTRQTTAATGLPEAAINVAGIYAALRDDIAQGTHKPSSALRHAVRLARLIDAAMTSSQEGQAPARHRLAEGVI